MLSRHLPDRIDIPTVCRAAESVAGPGSIVGAYGDGGLWRLYPRTHTGKATLLAKGLYIGNLRVPLETVNPFIIDGQTTERPATRLTAGPMPMSISDEALVRALESINIKIRSKVMEEMARINDKDRKLTDWKTCKRFMWIELPTTPPKEYLEVGPSRVKLRYKEMYEQSLKCWNCQEVGHRSSECVKDPVCHACNKPGHKKGDPECALSVSKGAAGGWRGSGGNARGGREGGARPRSFGVGAAAADVRRGGHASVSRGGLGGGARGGFGAGYADVARGGKPWASRGSSTSNGRGGGHSCQAKGDFAGEEGGGLSGADNLGHSCEARGWDSTFNLDQQEKGLGRVMYPSDEDEEIMKLTKIRW